MLNQKTVKDFKQIWKEEYGKKISDAEAEEIGTRLLKLFELLYKIDSGAKK